MQEWDEIHWYECRWYQDCPPNKTPHSELKLHDCLQFTFVPSILNEDIAYTKPTRQRNFSLLKPLHTLQKMSSWVVNLLPKTVGSVNLLFHLTPIISLLPCWSYSSLCKSKVKFLHLRHVVPIRIHSSSSWMTRSWIFWASKNKPRLGLNLFITSMCSHKCILHTHSSKLYFEFLKYIYYIYFSFNLWTIH